MVEKISVVIATYNMRKLLVETVDNCLHQTYPNMEIIVYDDCSTDDTETLFCKNYKYHYIKYHRGTTNLGVGGAFNAAMELATGEAIVLMCADDLFTHPKVLSDIVHIFNSDNKIGHVSRYYHQFVDGYPGAVRAWRGNDPIVLANNPSGLAFRKDALVNSKCSNRMFIETSYLVHSVLNYDLGWWRYDILRYDTIAARVHQSTSTQKGYWLKRRVSSPVQDWVSIGGTAILTDFTSFIQIKNGFTTKALLEEIGLFIKLKPSNLLMPGFWFYALVALLTPRPLLRRLPTFYRHRIGRLFTKEVKRPW